MRPLPKMKLADPPPKFPMNPTSRPAGTLRTALLANAAFSLTTGSLLLLFSARIAALLGPAVAPWHVLVVGGSLIPFGAFLAWLGGQKRPAPLIALAVSMADLAWVVGSAVGLALAGDAFSPTGVGIVAAIAACVLAFALGQLRGIARCYRPAGAPRGSIRVCLEFGASGNVDATWRNMSALGAIAQFVPMLAHSALREGARPGVGAVRECADRAGRCWAERCTRFDSEAREFEMEFLATEPGFPFPFAALRGGWSVQPGGQGVAVKIWWEGTLRRAALAPVMAPLLEWQARRQFAGVVRNMAEGSSAARAATPGAFSVVPC